MQPFGLVKHSYERILEVFTALIVGALTALIILGTVFRYLDNALPWYDEVASVGLVWLTYMGSALAALKGAHIGFPGIVNALPPNLRLAAVVVCELCIFGFFGLLAYTGWQVLVILEGMTLTSLPSISVQITQSIIPIGAVLFMLAEAMRLPETIAAARSGGFVDHEIAEALGQDDGDDGLLADADTDPQRAGGSGHRGAGGVS